MNILEDRLKRTKTNLYRRIQTTLHGRFKEKVFFLHVPKCGGTSIDHAIKSLYRNKDRTVTVNAAASTTAANLLNQINFPHETSDDYPVLKLRENLLLYFMSQNIKYISGHFSFSDTSYRNFSDEYTFITVLRDPVKRWISLYFFNRYKKEKHCKIEDDIKTFLQSDFGKSQGYEYVKFIGGIDNNRDYTSKQAIDRAKENLSKFDIVGSLENQEIFFKQIKTRFGVTLNISKKNLNPKNRSFIESIITEEIKENIGKICKPDLQIYKYALDRFVRANN